MICLLYISLSWNALLTQHKILNVYIFIILFPFPSQIPSVKTTSQIFQMFIHFQTKILSPAPAYRGMLWFFICLFALQFFLSTQHFELLHFNRGNFVICKSITLCFFNAFVNKKAKPGAFPFYDSWNEFSRMKKNETNLLAGLHQRYLPLAFVTFYELFSCIISFLIGKVKFFHVTQCSHKFHHSQKYSRSEAGGFKQTPLFYFHSQAEIAL